MGAGRTDMKLTKTFVGIGLALCLIAPALAQTADDAPAAKQERVKFDPKRDPVKDLEAAKVIARKDNKRILLDVGGEWCGWCKLLDQYFIDKKEIGAYLKQNYVVVKVNMSPENDNQPFLSRYPKIDGYPHFFVLDKEGKLLHSQNTGLLEEGKGYSDSKMMEFLQKWAPKKG
jgi:thioredoxin-related protein